jgi:outer membrane autotransporter protein
MSHILRVDSISNSGVAGARAVPSAATAISGLAGIAAATTVALSFVQPAQAQSFQDEMDALANTVCGSLAPCPSFGSTAAIGGQLEVQNDGLPAAVSERLRERQCEADGNANCLQAGGASADETSFDGLNLFVSTDYQYKRKDEAAEAGFRSDRAGFTVGLDAPMDWGVIGGALSYSHTFGDFDDGGGDFDVDSFGGLFYGSYYPSDASYIDAVIGLAAKDQKLDRRVVANNLILGNAEGDTIGFEFQGSLSGGYDFTFDNITVGPRVGVNYLRTEIDGFTETGNPLALSYEDQVEDSLTTTVGVQGSVAISTGFGVVVPQVSAEYVHEFLNDRRTIDAFALDGTPVSFVTDPPDRDYFNIGGGVVFVLPDGIAPFLNYSAQVANRFEELHTVTAGVRLEL